MPPSLESGTQHWSGVRPSLHLSFMSLSGVGLARWPPLDPKDIKIPRTPPLHFRSLRSFRSRLFSRSPGLPEVSLGRFQAWRGFSPSHLRSPVLSDNSRTFLTPHSIVYRAPDDSLAHPSPIRVTRRLPEASGSPSAPWTRVFPIVHRPGALSDLRVSVLWTFYVV